MKHKTHITTIIFSIIVIPIYAQLPLDYKDYYDGTKMWNGIRTVPFGDSVCAHFVDSLAIAKYSNIEKCDTFVYNGIHNNLYGLKRIYINIFFFQKTP